MKLKSECCYKFDTKAEACKKCPIMAPHGKKKRKKILAKIRSNRELRTD